MACRRSLFLSSVLVSLASVNAYIGVVHESVHQHRSSLCASQSGLCFTSPQQIRQSVPNKQRGMSLRKKMIMKTNEGENVPRKKMIMKTNEGENVPVSSEVETHLKQLLSRRKVLFSAATVGAAGLLRIPRAQAAPSDLISSVTSKAQESSPDLSPIIGEYNKAPGKLIVYPSEVVEKSPSDQYSYRALTLPNGLRVLLASDPKADTAAAALDVHVGHYSDPDDIPGLAHFNEHMLFLGNKKFPEEGQLEAFLSAHGGSSNAYTAGEDTCYFFTVGKDSLLPALERFSQFFVSPLFTAAATSRELNAIESENAKNLQSDSWRINQARSGGGGGSGGSGSGSGEALLNGQTASDRLERRGGAIGRAGLGGAGGAGRHRFRSGPSRPIDLADAPHLPLARHPCAVALPSSLLTAHPPAPPSAPRRCPSSPPQSAAGVQAAGQPGAPLRQVRHRQQGHSQGRPGGRRIRPARPPPRVLQVPPPPARPTAGPAPPPPPPNRPPWSGSATLVVGPPSRPPSWCAPRRGAHQERAPSARPPALVAPPVPILSLPTPPFRHTHRSARALAPPPPPPPSPSPPSQALGPGQRLLPGHLPANFA